MAVPRSLPFLHFTFLAALPLFFLLGTGAKTAPSTERAIQDGDSAEQILEAFGAQSKTWGDYSLTMETKVRRGEKSERQVLSFACKPPDWFRSTVIEGKDEGSTVARGKSGRIRAQAGGVLSLVKITMKEDDPRLADVRGARLQDAGWAFMVGQFLHRREQGWTFERLPDEAVRGVKCAVIQAAGPADKMGETREVFCFALRDLTVRARRLWEGDVLVDDTAYYEIKLNQNPPDEFFEL